LGKILNLGDGALGSVFAAIGTALPETIVPLVAILGGYIAGSNVQTGFEIGTGAILGSIFLLSTLAMSLVGFSILFFSKAKLRISEVSTPTDLFLRDFKFLIISYSMAILAAFIPFKPLIAGLLIFF
jgi:cation:H+ antiporter